MAKGMKKKLAILLTAAMTVGSLTACGGGGNTAANGADNSTGEDKPTVEASESKEDTNEATNDVAASGEKTGEGITIRLLTRMSGADSGTKLKEDVIAQFQAKYPDITIQDESTNDSNSFTNQFKTDIASGNVADIIQWPGVSIMKEYADTGVFLDLTDLIESTPDIKQNVDKTLLDMMELSPVGSPGTYALPINNQMEVFYYNKEIFEQAGIEKTPETWDEFFEVCDKLKEAGVTPWVVGASNAWRVVHIQTGLLYKMCGVEKAKELGGREAKWTDEDVVETIAFIKELADRGIFGSDYLGLDYETEKAMFVSGQTAMSFDGSWRISELADIEDHVGVFRMPYFTDREEFKDNDIAYPSQLELGGHLKDEPEKLEYVWELASMFASQETQQRYAYDCGNIPVRGDVELDESKMSPLLADLLAIKGTEVEVWGSDAWAYDTVAVLEDIVGEAFVGALTGMTAEEAAEQIQTRLEAAQNQ